MSALENVLYKLGQYKIGFGPIDVNMQSVEIDKATAEYKQLIKMLDEAVAWHEGDRSPHAKLEQTIAQLQTELESANATIAAGALFTTQLAELEGTIRIVNKALSTAVEGRDAYASSLHTTRTENYRLTQRLAQKEITLSAACKRIEELREYIEWLEARK